MPGNRGIDRLTAAEIKAAKPGDKLRDAGDVTGVKDADGNVLWTQHYRSRVIKTNKGHRKPREMGLGVLGLKELRMTTRFYRAYVKSGNDPLHDAEQRAQQIREAIAEREREAERNAATLENCSREYYLSIRGQFRSEKHSRQWYDSMVRYIPPKLWKMPVDKITADDLLRMLLPLAERVPESAKRVRTRIAAVFDDAMLRGLCSGNPAQAIRRRLRIKRRIEPLRALAYVQLPALVAALRAFERVSLVVRLALLFTIATAARSGETRGARWSEIDLAARLWVVPPSRMKAGEEHRVPLSDYAMEILREAEALRSDEQDSLVFPAPRNPRQPLSDMALSMALRRLETGHTRDDGEREMYSDLSTVHGMRSAFSSWANESARARPDVVEVCLAHKERDRVRASYQRAKFDDERRALLQRWSRYLSQPAQSNVVPIARGA